MSQKKILIALFRLPYPATDGTRFKILHNLIEGLSEDYDLEFFVVNISRYHPENIAYLEKNYGKVHFFDHSKIEFLINDIPALWTGLPHQSQAFHFTDAQHWLDDHIHEYDAVYIHEIRMTEYFIHYDDDMKQKFLVDFNDAISMNYRQGTKTMNIFKKLFYAWEGFLVARYESLVLKNFKHFSIVSERDKNYLLDNLVKSNSKNIDRVDDFSVIHHGAPIGEQIAVTDAEKIFFMGSLDYEPNQDALTYFLENIWSKILEKSPTCELLVIGGGSVPTRFRSYQNVVFLGFVPDVFQVIARCRALVAPIRFAGGTPSKILEAMGYGIPVITTPTAAAGIPELIHETNAIIISESDTQAWADAIHRLFTDNLFKQKLATNGRQLILESYSQPAAQEAFRKRFAGILE